jgi:DNA-binding transcriptional LysR family regulator
MREPAAALRAFRLVAERASFTRAAEVLDVTPSALSQVLLQLEEHLDVRLLQRTTRRVGLTEAGRQLLERITGPLSEIDAALDETRQHSGRPAGRLTITTSRTAASAFIEPILPEFFALYPEITLDLRIERDLVDVIGEGVDAGIRLGEKLDRDMICVALSGPIRSVVVATPSYFDGHGRPAHPRDLAGHKCIRVKSVTGRQPVAWDFCEDGRWFDVEVRGGLLTNDSATALRAALNGVGLRHALLLDVQEHLAAGRLETVLDAWLPPYEGFFLYYSSRAQIPSKLRVFIDCVRKHARRDEHYSQA